MAHKKSIGLPLAILLLSSFGAAIGQSAHPAGEDLPAGTALSRLAGDWRSGERLTLAASRPLLPSSAPSTMLGAAPSQMRLDRVILLLEPSMAQRQALSAKIADQQNSASPAYRHWLTAEAFAKAYSNSSADIDAVCAWLRSQGFQVAALPAGRGWIEFSGTVAQVEQAFDTQVDSVAAGGETRAELAGPVSVPAALKPVIHGLVSLDGALSAPAVTATQAISTSAAELAAETSLSCAQALPPQLMARLLQLDALHAAGVTGKSETIAIAGRSDVRSQDIAAFRAAFSLPPSPLAVAADGPDPGYNASDQAEATMAATWAGAAAPGAQIVLVPAATTNATDGVDLSLAAIVDQALAHTVAVGYSACEPALSEAHQAFYAALYQQAAAEGIAVIAAAGDSGPAACQAAGSEPRVSTGYAVNALAATPWNTAVGVAGFGEAGPSAALAAWSQIDAADAAYAGGGGASSIYLAPAWQPQGSTESAGLDAESDAANTMEELKSAGLTPGYRLLPDVALPAALDSGVNRGLAFCLSDAAATGSAATAGGCTLVRAGGSSAAAAILAGIGALVAQKYGAQGNLAPDLYALSRSAASASIFTDVAKGSAQLECVAGSTGCDADGRIGFAAAAGYDMATGLGSVNAQALVEKWPRPQATGTQPVTITLSMTPITANNYYNPSASVTFSGSVVDPTLGGLPTGTLTFINASTGASLAGASTGTLDSNGNVSVTLLLTNVFTTQGTYQVSAVYSGDSFYAGPTTASQQLSLTTQKSSMALTVTPSSIAPEAGATMSVTVTLAVAASSVAPAGTASPTGQITLNLAGGPNAETYTAQAATASGVTTATFSAVTVPGVGQFTLQASYAGDTNYAAATSPSVTITVAQGTTTTTLAVTGSATLGVLDTPYTLTATITPSGTTPAPTGTVKFYDGGLLLGTASISGSSTAYTATITASLANNTTHAVRAVYSGDANWTGSVSNIVDIPVTTLADTVVLTANNLTTDPVTGLLMATPGQDAILVATVTPAVPPTLGAGEQYPTGYVDFYLVNGLGNTLLGRELLARSGISDVSAAVYTSATLPGGDDSIIAFYEGDTYYDTGTSNSLILEIQSFTIVADPSNPAPGLTIVKGATGSATYDITGLGGYAGQIQVTCTVPSNIYMTCEASPQQVVPYATVTFNIGTFSTGSLSSTTAGRRREPPWPRAASGAALALLGFFLLPFGRRARIFTERSARRFWMALLLLVGLGGVGIGCNSVSLGTSTYTQGTPLGTVFLTITAAPYIDNTVVHESLTLPVNVVVAP
jgi:uncharacterized protein YceK